MTLGLWSAAQLVAADRERERSPRLTLDEDVLRESVRSLPGAAGTALRQFMEMESAAEETLPLALCLETYYRYSYAIGWR